MKRYLSGAILALSLCGTISAWAADSHKTVSSSMSDNISNHDDGFAPANVTIGPALLIGGGNTAFGISVGGLFRATQQYPIYVGADLGINFWSYAAPSVGVSSSATGYQLLPTAVYALRQDAVKNFYPFLGLSVGPMIYSSSVTGPGVSTTSTVVQFELLLRPGANYLLTKSISLGLEPKFGVLNGSFVFVPTVSAVISI